MIKNQFKTAILLGLLTALLLGVGSFFGKSGILIAAIFVLLMNFGTYWFSDKIVLAMYKAKLASPSEYSRLHSIVDEVTFLAKIPKPKVWILPSTQSNAFATGRNPNHASIACTEGILNLMNDDELKGVIAHEIGHIKNRDILISTVAGIITGIISYVAFMARWAAIFGGFGGRDRDGDSIVGLIVLAVVTPLMAAIIQLAISRSREYLADESAAKLLRNSAGLVSALEKLEGDAKRHPLRLGNRSTAHMFISNPFKGKAMMSLLSTHPPMDSRIKRLNELKI
tara:strand:+ start:2960 stop:3808 length:849 start_codon:yes stop_codon:yes gene_type:complete